MSISPLNNNPLVGEETATTPAASAPTETQATLGTRVVAAVKDAGNAVVAAAGQAADGVKAVAQATKEKTVAVFSAAKEKTSEACDAVVNASTNLGQESLDTAAQTVDQGENTAIAKTRAAAATIVDKEISFFNKGGFKFFGVAGAEVNTVTKAIASYKNTVATQGDAISRGAARATYLGTKAVLTLILSVGGLFKGGVVVAEGLATALAAIVRGVGTVATAFFTYLPEILTLAAVAGAGFAASLGGIAAGAVVALTAAALLVYVVHNEASKAGIRQEAQLDTKLALSQAGYNARKAVQAEATKRAADDQRLLELTNNNGTLLNEHSAKLSARIDAVQKAPQASAPRSRRARVSTPAPVSRPAPVQRGYGVGSLVLDTAVAAGGIAALYPELASDLASFAYAASSAAYRLATGA